MGISTIDAGMLKNAFLAGAKGLEAKKDWINELNVFPGAGQEEIPELYYHSFSEALQKK